MPGSLRLPPENYSSISDYSGRSLDAKTNGKKVSFNNAVRVKQYPWKPNFEILSSDHLTLPSDRFWFKVYKSKEIDYYDSPKHGFYKEPAENTGRLNGKVADYDTDNYNRDPLTPIAEIDDQVIEDEEFYSRPTYLSRQNDYQINLSTKSPICRNTDRLHSRSLSPGYKNDILKSQDWNYRSVKDTLYNDAKSRSVSPKRRNDVYLYSNADETDGKIRNGGEFYTTISQAKKAGNKENVSCNDEYQIHLNLSNKYPVRKNGIKHVWGSDSENEKEISSKTYSGKFGYSKKYDTEYGESKSRYDLSGSIKKEVSGNIYNRINAWSPNTYASNENGGNDFKNTVDPNILSFKLPRTSTRNVSPLRASLRKLNCNDSPRIRRCRSHDNYQDDQNWSKQLTKTNKSISTDDLNNASDKVNGFHRSRKDISTQCYGTLDRSNPKYFGTTLSKTLNSISEIERFRNFQSSATSNYQNEAQSKETNASKLSRIHKGNNTKASCVQNTNYFYASKSNGKTLDRKLANNEYGKFPYPNNIESPSKKLPPPGPSTKSSFSNKFANKCNFNSRKFSEINQDSVSSASSCMHSKPQVKRPDFHYSSLLKGKYPERKFDEVGSGPFGYLRGRQIPLSENSASRKILGKTQSSPKSENKMSMSPSDIKSRETKNYNSHYRGIPETMIDWSLSGFQLSNKAQNGLSSKSDSEYTINRRTPLLMYIPGVSHHDYPAEDDRFSAFSDLSSITGSDLKRHNSMPKEGKSKWIKWRSKK